MTKAERREVELCVIDVLSYTRFKTAKEIKEEVNAMLEKQEMSTVSLTDIRTALSRVERDSRLRKKRGSDSYAYYNVL